MLRKLLVGIALLGLSMGVWACGQRPGPEASTPIPIAPDRLTGTPDVRIAIAQKYASAQLVKALGTNTSGMESPTLEFLPPNRARIGATVRVGVLGQTLSLRPAIMMHFNAINGRAVVDIDGIDLGGVGIPRSAIQDQLDQLKQQAEVQANTAITQAVAGTNLKLAAISADDTTLVLDFNE